MLTAQIHPHPIKVSPKEALYAYVDQLSPEQQREFVVAALQLIASRPAPFESAMVVDNPHISGAGKRAITH
jgi:hypothetical protein